jgi:3-hydroxybutyryl-CoA dehydratase
VKHKRFEEIDSDEAFVSHGRTVTETDVVNFCALAGLKLPIFIDAEYCRQNSPFGQRIVPGILIQALAAGMMEELIGPYTIAALGFGESRFAHPTFIGDTLRTRSRVQHKRLTSRPDRGLIDIAVVVGNQRGEDVMKASYRLLVQATAGTEPRA